MNITLILVILIASILIQITAAFLAFRLISITKKSSAWLFIIIAICLMIIWRYVASYQIVNADLSHVPDITGELVALFVSLCVGGFRRRAESVAFLTSRNPPQADFAPIVHGQASILFGLAVPHPVFDVCHFLTFEVE